MRFTLSDSSRPCWPLSQLCSIPRVTFVHLCSVNGGRLVPGSAIYRCCPGHSFASCCYLTVSQWCGAEFQGYRLGSCSAFLDLASMSLSLSLSFSLPPSTSTPVSPGSLQHGCFRVIGILAQKSRDPKVHVQREKGWGSIVN